MRLSIRASGYALAIFGLLDGAASAVAQSAAASFPSKTIRIVSPAQPGGAADVLARALGEELRRAFNQTVLIENRPGAGGNTGSDSVAKSEPDGHTLLLSPTGPVLLNQFMYARMPYDAQKAFAGITMVADMPLVLVVHPKTKITSVQALVSAAQAGALYSFGLSNIGGANHIALLLFERTAGVKIAHVPYRGANPVAQDLVAGQIEGAFINPLTVMSQIEDKLVTPLAVVADKRLAALPDVPTLAQAGIDGVAGSTWFALLVPAATPRPVVERLNVEVVKALRLPAIAERFEKMGATLIANSPAELDAYLEAERAKWGPIIKLLGLKAD